MARDPMERGFVSVPIQNDLGVEVFTSIERIVVDGEDGEPKVVLDPMALDLTILTIKGPMAIVAEVAALIERAAKAEIEREEAQDGEGVPGDRSAAPLDV